MTKCFNSSTGLLLALCCVNVGVGQQTVTQPAQNRANTARQTESTQLDQPMVEFFASKLVLCNNAQIQMSQLATTKSANSDVKKFAEMLASDHAALNAQLKPFIASYGEQPVVAATDRISVKKPVVTGAAEAQSGQANVNSKAQPETGSHSGDHAVLHQLFEICQAVHVNQMAAGADMLTQKSGSEFDKAYMGSQVVGHMALMAELKALESRSPKEFQNIIRAATTSVESHMQKASGICKVLDKQKEETTTSNR